MQNTEFGELRSLLSVVSAGPVVTGAAMLSGAENVALHPGGRWRQPADRDAAMVVTWVSRPHAFKAYTNAFTGPSTARQCLSQPRSGREGQRYANQRTHSACRMRINKN